MSNIASTLAAAEASSDPQQQQPQLAQVSKSTASNAGGIDDIHGLPVALLSEGLSNIDLVGLDLPPVDRYFDYNLSDYVHLCPTMLCCVIPYQPGNHRLCLYFYCISDDDDEVEVVQPQRQHRARSDGGVSRRENSTEGKDEAAVAISRSVSQPVQAMHRRTPRKIKKMKREKKVLFYCE